LFKVRFGSFDYINPIGCLTGKRTTPKLEIAISVIVKSIRVFKVKIINTKTLWRLLLFMGISRIQWVTVSQQTKLDLKKKLI